MNLLLYADELDREDHAKGESARFPSRPRITKRKIHFSEKIVKSRLFNAFRAHSTAADGGRPEPKILNKNKAIADEEY
jgi:hypothetical protein